MLGTACQYRRVQTSRVEKNCWKYTHMHTSDCDKTTPTIFGQNAVQPWPVQLDHQC